MQTGSASSAASQQSWQLEPVLFAGHNHALDANLHQTPEDLAACQAIAEEALGSGPGVSEAGRHLSHVPKLTSDWSPHLAAAFGGASLPSTHRTQ